MHPVLPSKEFRAAHVVKSRGAWSKLAWSWLVCTALTIGARGATVFSPTMAPDSKVEIRLETWLEALPSHGFVPVTVRIRNGSAQEQTWTITSSNGYGMGGGGLGA